MQPQAKRRLAELEALREVLGDLNDLEALERRLRFAQRTNDVTSLDLDEVQRLLGEESPGRPLDFLSQELAREANTIGSKSADVEIAHTVVEIKTFVERLREQVQNLE